MVMNSSNGIVAAHLLGFGNDDGIIAEQLPKTLLCIRAVAAPGDNPLVERKPAASLIEAHARAEREEHCPPNRFPAYDIGGVHVSFLRLFLPFLVSGF